MLSTHKHTHKEKNMFFADSIIDAVQGAKKTFVNTFVTDDKFKTQLNKLVDAQTGIAKSAAKASMDIADAFVQHTTEAFRPAKGAK